MTTPMQSPRRRAFSIVELLVVIGILGVLTTILLGALFKVHLEAQRANCSNNLRQIVMALHMFHDDHGTFPTSGGTGGLPPKFGWSYVPSSGPHREIGFGEPDPNLDYVQQRGSWTYTLLPYLERAAVYQTVSYSTPIDVYVCRARRNPEAYTCPSTDPVTPGVSFNFAGVNPWSKSDYNANGLLIQCWGRSLCSLSQITDGTANTILVGEKSLDPRNYRAGGWYWDEPAFIGCNVRWGTCVYQDKIGVPFPDNWGSAHPDSAPFAFADGSVRPIRYNTSSTLMQALLTPSGGEDVSAFGF
jgi:prepilin-type N-terminal cleavage/methylation domain-containing protein/prepilin-type processing-associated H-X9-DG protein